MYNILTLNKISKKGLARLDEAKYATGDAFKEPDAVIVRSASMHEMEIPASVKAIARAGAGYNNIPVDTCTQKGICVFNTPGANANAVKELCVCALLLTSRKVVAGTEWIKTLKGSGAEVSKKVEKGKSSFAGPEIQGKTIGVIGLGAIGVLVANAADALGMTVYGYDPFLSDKAANTLNDDISITSSLDVIFETSDYITLHIPLNDSTRDTISAATLAKCKDGVRILNFARGDLVNSADILEALESGKCAAYATDFPTDEMLGVENVIAIPHLGASTPESEENCAVMAAEQVSEYLETGNTINSVNLPNISKNVVDGASRVTVITNGDVSADVYTALAKTGIANPDAIAAIKKSTGYIILDITSDANAAAKAIESVDGVIAIRII